MKKVTIILFLLLLIASLSAQSLTWTDITSQFTLPDGIKIFQGERQSPPLKAWYLTVDLNQKNIAIRPYLSTSAAGKEGVAPFCQRVGAIAAINGGFFGDATSYSAVVYPNEVLAQNISAVVRAGTTYPLTRSFFGMTDERKLSVDWIYHFGGRVEDIFTFDRPAANREGIPAPTPIRADGKIYEQLLVGIGGGPTLVKDSTIHISYTEEVFWGSGVENDARQPRTAVGYTKNNHVILIVADGRQAASEGVTLPELAQILLELGCIEAMNLDGGGSSQMAVGNQLINRPEGGTYMRPVPTILAVVYSDSLAFPKKILFEKIIDTADPECSLVGLGWFPTANAGFWGGTPSMLNNRGAGDRYAQFRLDLARPARYELFAWWVAAPNRCKDTPFIVTHQNGVDTLRLDQTANGSKWNSLGSYFFQGDTSESIIISNRAATGTYIVADAVRIVSYDSAAVTSMAQWEDRTPVSDYQLLMNYPNPFNAVTTIKYRLPKTSNARLRIVDLLGKQVMLLVDGRVEAGSHEIHFDARDLPSGLYFCQIEWDRNLFSHKILVLK